MVEIIEKIESIEGQIREVVSDLEKIGYPQLEMAGLQFMGVAMTDVQERIAEFDTGKTSI